MIRRLWLSTCLAVATAASASAADLPAEKGPPAYEPPPAPVFSWTGFYLGGQAGYAWGGDSISDIDGLNNAAGRTYSLSADGFVGSGVIGYNYEINQFVAGLEANVGYMGLSRTNWEPNAVNVTSNHIDSGLYGDVTGRLGYAFDRVLAYVKGGWAFYDGEANINNTLGGFGGGIATSGDFMGGWTVGGGLEYAFDPDWSVKVEYQYFDFGTETATLVTPANGNFRFSNHLTVNAVTAGVDYHFNPPPPPAPPLVTKY